MSRRTALAVVGALVGYGLLYLLGMWMVWRVPEYNRDGLEWMLVFFMTVPWSLAGGLGLGWPLVHAGAVVNAVLIAVFAGRKVSRTSG